MAFRDSGYRALFEHDPDALVVVDPETYRIRECNHRFSELCGTDREELLDRDFTTLTTTDSASETALTALLRSGPIDDETVESRLRTDRDGSVPVEMRLSTATVDGDDLVLVRATDVTERRERDCRLERKSRAVEAAPIGVTISDPTREDNPLVFANERFRRLTGYSEAEVLGRNCRFLQGPDTNPETVAEIRAAIDAEEAITTEILNYRKDGEAFWNRVMIAPVRDDTGTVVSFVGFQGNVTEQKQSRHELELAHGLLETVPSGVFRTDPTPHGTFEYVNPALVSLLGADSPAALREHRVEEFYVDPAEREELISTLEDTDKRRVSREVRLETLDGKRIDAMITASISEDETGTKHVQKVVQDISERKRYERRLREQRDNLDILNQVVRHDIRNDLQLVTAYVEFLADLVGEEGETYVETIRDSADHAVELTRTAGDMADVMLADERDRQSVPLRNALESELDEVRSKYDAAVVTVSGSIPGVQIVADEMLNSVFRNLLSNAIQHNDKAVPEVSVSVTERGETVVVRVADNGPGVPDGHKDAIFGKGEKGLESAGTGLGLYLVKTLVESYDGDVWVEDNDPEGAVFVVELSQARS
ncbi:PAS domain S-box protein [Halobellus sp. GM3]|uniref:PAS domain S-box protein n=1 Tax=Halobellus sp. GM3 TaxID=3458410 RepID=UPI00403DF7A7